MCDDFNLKFSEAVLITEETPALPIRYYSSKPEEKEIYLTLVSENLGEMTYLIKVIVDPMPEIKMEPFQVELGKMHKEKVVFENTDDVAMTVICKSTNPSIFSSEHEQFTVPARSSCSNYLVYRASSLEIEEGKLYFSSDRNAKWAYHLSGYGLPQSKPDIKEMVVSMGEHIC